MLLFTYFFEKIDFFRDAINKKMRAEIVTERSADGRVSAYTCNVFYV